MSVFPLSVRMGMTWDQKSVRGGHHVAVAAVTAVTLVTPICRTGSGEEPRRAVRTTATMSGTSHPGRGVTRVTAAGRPPSGAALGRHPSRGDGGVTGVIAGFF